jgi:ankyrin repeat protein
MEDAKAPALQSRRPFSVISAFPLWFNSYPPCFRGNYDQRSRATHFEGEGAMDQSSPSTSPSFDEFVTLSLDAPSRAIDLLCRLPTLALMRDPRSSESLLHYLAIEGAQVVTKWLVNHGADVNARDRHGRCIVHDLVFLGSDQLLEFILQNEADPNILTSEGDSPLSIAAQENKVTPVGLLVRYGASVHAKGRYGETALYVAARNGHREVYRLLLTLGADAAAMDDHGHTPREYVDIYGL